MIYQTNKSVSFLSRKIYSSREMNLISGNSFFLTTSDPGHRWDERYVIFFSFFIIYNFTKITLFCNFDVTNVNKLHHLHM